MGEQARREALWCERRPDGRIACLLCPHACVIAEGGHGICGVRFNRDGTLEIPFYGRISSLAVDPIEKKPLYHLPSRLTDPFRRLCGLLLPLQVLPELAHLPGHRRGDAVHGPCELVEAARREHSFGDRLHLLRAARPCGVPAGRLQQTRAAGLKNVLVSNGYINPGPAEEVLALMDAANIDLKAFDPEFYRTETGGKLEEVKRFITPGGGAHPPGDHDAGHPDEERHGRPDRGDRAVRRIPRPRDSLPPLCLSSAVSVLDPANAAGHASEAGRGGTTAPAIRLHGQHRPRGDAHAVSRVRGGPCAARRIQRAHPGNQSGRLCRVRGAARRS